MSDPITDLKHELVAAAERQQRQDAVAERGRLRRVRRPRLLLSVAALAVAAGVALVVVAPWSGSPSFLDKAQAALTPPAGSVLHTKVQGTSTSTDLACTVTHVREMWIDETPPHRYRAFLDLPSGACSNGTPVEVGGTLDTGQVQFMFVPPDTLDAGRVLGFKGPADPVQTLRDAISAGTATDEGPTQLDGRTVERISIRFKCPLEASGTGPACPNEPSYIYVDPQTFYPVEGEGPAVIQAGGQPAVVVHNVAHFLTYEYLPATAANLALTNIQAQHPNATISG